MAVAVVERPLPARLDQGEPVGERDLPLERDRRGTEVGEERDLGGDRQPRVVEGRDEILRQVGAGDDGQPGGKIDRRHSRDLEVVDGDVGHRDRARGEREVQRREVAGGHHEEVGDAHDDLDAHVRGCSSCCGPAGRSGTHRIRTTAPSKDLRAAVRHQAATVTATSKFARLGKALVVPFTQERLADGSGYRLVIHPPLEGFPGETEEADCLRINQWVEGVLRDCPEQYLWAHRRFKSRPPGEPKLYPRNAR